MDGEEISHILLLYDLAPSAPPLKTALPNMMQCMLYYLFLSCVCRLASVILVPGSNICVSVNICYITWLYLIRLLC